MLCTLQHCFKKNKSRKRRVKRVAKVWKCRLNRRFGEFSPRNYQSSRRRRRCRRKGIWVSHRLIWLFRFIISSAVSARVSFTSLRAPQMAQKIFIIELICVSQSPIHGCDCPVVSLRLIWLSRFYYFLLRFLRFPRETINPLADCADAAERGCISRHLSQRAEPHENS